MKKSDFLREFARCIDMCEGTNVNANGCYRSKSQDYFFGNNFNRNDFDLDDEFAIAIVDNLPVFVGDELYWKSGFKIVVHNADIDINGVTHIYDKNGNSANVDSLSWNPPKPKTFNLNGAELPLPKRSVPIDNNKIYVLGINRIDFYFESTEDAVKVSNALIDLLSGK